MQAEPPQPPTARHLVLYDGVCGLCNGAVQWIVRHDPAGLFRFAPLQSGHARDVLAPYGRQADELTTFFVIADVGTGRARLLAKSTAALAVLQALGGGWRLLSLFRWVPRVVRDGVYDWVARHRYGWFGKADTCFLPPPELRDRFWDDGSAPSPEP